MRKRTAVMGIMLSIALMLLVAGCTKQSAPAPSPIDPGGDTQSPPDAEAGGAVDTSLPGLEDAPNDVDADLAELEKAVDFEI